MESGIYEGIGFQISYIVARINEDKYVLRCIQNKNMHVFENSSNEREFNNKIKNFLSNHRRVRKNERDN